VSESQSKIVVIDDSLGDTQLVVDCLTVHKFDVQLWIDANGWIDRLAESPPDLVMLNVHTRGDGFRMALELKRHPGIGRIPLVFITQSHEADEKIRGLEAGAVDYVCIPFLADELVHRVKAAVAKGQLVEQMMACPMEDGLTGLPNREAFREHLLQANHRASQDDLHHFAVLFVDLDRFKLINDGMGRPMGDAVLQKISKRLFNCVRTQSTDKREGNDIVARLGADEFAVLLDALQTPKDALTVAERLITDLGKPLVINGMDLSVSCSVGIRYCDGMMIDAESMLGDSDMAMYEAKSRGKARCVVFNDEMRKRAIDRFQIERDMRQALVREQFVVVYQPFVNLETGLICGFEALIRWIHPERGMVNPDQFITIAEESGLILEIGEWILRAAMQQRRKWVTQFPGQDITIGVNLSKKQIDHPGLLVSIDGVLQDFGGKPEGIKLEVTESTIMHDKERVVSVLNELRERGFSLAMDDFGTGESSLACLHEFPISVLKIDKAFINNLDHTRGYTAIVNAIVTLAHNLDMIVIAEGIEKHAHLVQLQAMECDIGQGYLFSRPVDAENATYQLADVFNNISRRQSA